MLIAEVKISASTTLLPVELKALACCIKDFILTFFGMLDTVTNYELGLSDPGITVPVII